MRIVVIKVRVKIPKHNLTNRTFEIYNKPKKVYIPLISGNDTDITILVSPGEYVYKGSMIGKRKGDLRIPIHSSVSGTVLDFEEHTCFNGKKVKCVVIENDFKEKIEQKITVKKDLNSYSFEEFIEILKDSGIVGMGGAGFPTYIKYDTDKKKQTLIVNAVECEPYIMADATLATAKCEEILETIDAILEINHMQKAIIAIGKNNIALKEIFDNFIGTYLKIEIKIVPYAYAMGWERMLVKEITGKEYDKLPIEQGIIVNNISTIYAIYEALKYHKPLIERIITFTGEGFKQPKNILVKVGTPLKEVVEFLGLSKEAILISGGPMMGVQVDDDMMISRNQNCILGIHFQKEQASQCIKCGKCVEVCPAKLSPVLIMKNCKNKDKLKGLEPNRCMECGLCSYICPVNLPVREFVKDAKETVRGVK